MPVQYKCVCPSIYLQDYCKAEADMFLFEVQQSVIPCRNTSTRALKGVVLVGQISWYPGVILLSLAVQFQALPFHGCDTSEWGSSDLTSNALRHPKSFWSETNCPGAHEIRRMWAKKQESIAGRGRPDFWLKWKKKKSEIPSRLKQSSSIATENIIPWSNFFRSLLWYTDNSEKTYLSFDI